MCVYIFVLICVRYVPDANERDVKELKEEPEYSLL